MPGTARRRVRRRPRIRQRRPRDRERNRLAQVVDYLQEALAISLLVAVPSAPGRYRFAHEIVRDVLYGELLAPRAMPLHRRVAKAKWWASSTACGSSSAA